jgi:serine/threonine protein phosphatase PrpC
MKLKCFFKYISIAKIGNAEIENEDNVLVPSDCEIENGAILRFAISDGATESSFSKEWSDILVKGFRENSFDKATLPTTIESLSRSWYKITSTIELPWYAEQKLGNGAFATFLGVTINLIDSNLESVSLGDCTLFLIRNNELFKTFPITNLEDFGNTPYLFSTNSQFQTDFTSTVKYSREQIESGDMLILASDALALWLFKSAKAGEIPWISLFILLSGHNYLTDFSEWAKHKINTHEIKNDDISVILINIE